MKFNQKNYFNYKKIFTFILKELFQLFSLQRQKNLVVYKSKSISLRRRQIFFLYEIDKNLKNI
jgi:hypothetical protein